jgi:hypothetical protein
MTKQELAHIAKILLDWKNECKNVNNCKECAYLPVERFCRITDIPPAHWAINEADIERLEREE